MSSPTYITFLLAEQDRMQGLSRAFRANKEQYNTDDVIYGLLILAGILAVMIIIALVNKFRQRRSNHTSPWGLFLSLCRAHKLKWSERWLLWQLARLEHLADPARLFLEPDWFKSSGLPPALRAQAARLKSIRDRLFAELKGNINLSDDEKSHSDRSTEAKGAALPTLKAAPKLDVPPWPATALSPPSPPLTNSSDNAPV